jgi:hypothetical protein
MIEDWLPDYKLNFIVTKKSLVTRKKNRGTATTNQKIL